MNTTFQSSSRPLCFEKAREDSTKLLDPVPRFFLFPIHTHTITTTTTANIPTTNVPMTPPLSELPAVPVKADGDGVAATEVFTCVRLPMPVVLA